MCPPGSVNCGPGIYSASLPRRYKALVFINVNVSDLYVGVKLYVAVERCVNEEGRDWMDGQTDGDMGDGHTEKTISHDAFIFLSLFLVSGHIPHETLSLLPSIN